MRKEEFDYISDFVADMNNDETVVRILKQNYAFNFTDADFEKLDLSIFDKKFYLDFATSNILAAYAPFLDIIINILNDAKINVSDLMEKLDIYSLNRNLFTSYALTNVATHIEEPILGEKAYNQSRFIDDLVKLMEYICKTKKVFILLNNVNQICDSSLSILNKFIKKDNKNLKIFIITNAMGIVREYIKNEYNDFIKESSYLGIVYEWPLSGFLDESETKTTLYISNTQDDINKLETLFNTYAYRQAEYYLTIIYEKIEIEKLLTKDLFKFQILNLYVMTSIFMENYSHALILCEKLMGLNYPKDDDAKLFNYNKSLSLTNMYMGNEEKAYEHAEKCHEIAKKTGKEKDIFVSMLLLNMSQLGGWKDIWFCDKEIDVSERLIELCYKYSYYNHLSHILVYDFDNEADLYTTPDGVEQRTVNTTKGISIAKHLDNDFFLFEAYRKNVMISSINGHYETSNYFYNKAIEIVRHNHDKMEEANIYNGLGYNNVTEGNYEKANEYYNQALKIFYDEGSSDYITETLYNMGTNALLAGDYRNATNYLMTVSQIIQYLRKSRIRVCNNSKIYCLLAISSFKQGNFFTAQVYANKSEHFLMYAKKYLDDDPSYGHQWDDDTFLYYIVSAQIAMKNNDYEKAKECFKESEFYMARSQGSYFLNFALYSMEKITLLELLGEKEEREKLIDKAYEYFASYNTAKANYYKNLKEKNVPAMPYLNISLKDVTIDEIMSFIKIESVSHEAYIKDSQIKFFGTFQELASNSYTSPQHQLNTLVENFKNNFRVDNMLYVSFEKSGPVIKYSDFEYEISEDEINFIAKYLKNNSTGFAVSQFSDTYYDYEKIIKIFDRSRLFSIMCAPVFNNDILQNFCITLIKVNSAWNSVVYRDTVERKDLDVFNLFFRLLIDASEKYQLNEKLRKQAITDELTGLMNRQGYYSTIEKKLNTALIENRSFSCAFLYIDLDHFKYYNDPFGHHVGDAILIRFSEIFKTVCENTKGFPVRFGGDEFLIIIEDGTIDQVKEIVDNIYKFIEKEDGFSKIVQKYSLEEIEIPASSRATCSIGADLKTNITSMLQVGEMEKHADESLYYIKEHGRGSMITYEDYLKTIK